MDFFDQLKMASDLVIKVKHGNTLRRFNACTVDLNMSVLKAKILDLFKFNSDADLTLTYIDEDSDVVTLVDDEDLCDAIGQRLNPLRLTVLLNTTNRVGRVVSRSESGTSTPVKLPEVRIPPPLNINTGFVEALKYMPEEFRRPLLKLTNDALSKAASSVPPELGHVFEFGRKHLVPPSRGSEDGGMEVPVNATFSPVDLNDIKEETAPDISAKFSEVVAADPLVQLLANSSKQNDDSITRDRDTSASPSAAAAGTVDLNIDIPRALLQEPVFTFKDELGSALMPLVCAEEHKTKSQRGCNDLHDGNYFAAGGNKSSTLPSADDLMDLNPPPASEAPEVLRSSVPPVCLYPSAPQMGAFTKGVFPFIGTGFSEADLNSNSQSTFPNACDVQLLHGQAFPFDSGRRSYVLPDMSRTFHRGVQCDGCGMHPIIGPRYKSKVKENYDLCNICFSEMGNEAEYTRIERSSYRAPKLFKEFYNHHPRFHGPPHPSVRGCGAKQSRARLESRFIQDVTILDGTVMAPSTRFTKIWRMRNSGTLPWPRQTQLVWIGGDQFGDKNSVELEIMKTGCAVDSELDIAVDFTSPPGPGRYISYWRMASPSGQKFGQRVWVLIQVDMSMCQQESPSESFHAALNLNLPPETSSEKGKKVQESIDVNLNPVDSNQPEDGFMPPKAIIKPVKPVANPAGKSPEFDSVGPLIDVSNIETGVIPATAATVEYPIIDISMAPSEPSIEDAGLSFEAVAVAAVEQSKTVEESLLKELEEMGFKQIDLNKEVLRMNEYNLEQSVDDLCGVAEWDPLLEELQEMGFCDEETNKKLLIKNGGSIKRVVLDLITGEKTG